MPCHQLVYIPTFVKAVAQRSAINDAYHDGRLQRALNLPPPEVVPSEDTDDSSDMNLSDGEEQPAGKSLRRDTHAFSAEEVAKTRLDAEESDASQDSDSAKAEIEESRYTAKPQRPVADATTRRTVNRFDSLQNQTVEFVMSDSDTEESVDEDSITAHAKKRRRIEAEPRPGQSRRDSRRAYWAGKGPAE